MIAGNLRERGPSIFLKQVSDWYSKPSVPILSIRLMKSIKARKRPSIFRSVLKRLYVSNMEPGKDRPRGGNCGQRSNSLGTRTSLCLDSNNRRLRWCVNDSPLIASGLSYLSSGAYWWTAFLCKICS